MPCMALVVDDSMLIRHAVCRYFESRGFLVESATNGAEASEMLNHITPDLVVTDLQMPKMTGSELISVVRSRPETSGVPIIVVAGRRSSSEPFDESRADFVIYKDIDINQQLDSAVEAVFPQSVVNL